MNSAVSPAPAASEGSDASAGRAVRENRAWYHTIELAPGVVTPGAVDLRGVAERMLPQDLSGRRALDVGTFDGFWAFEMERRGAEVVALDVERVEAAEWPPASRSKMERAAQEWGVDLGKGFALASELLESRVQRVIRNVYDLDADAIGGSVDFAFSGAILLHLRDPVRALERVRSVLVPNGELRLMEPFSVPLTLRAPRRPSAVFRAAESGFGWWLPNLATLHAWPRAAGFSRTERIAFTRPPARRVRQLYVGLACRRG
jgi:SAM-dependent methyltransferase